MSALRNKLLVLNAGSSSLKFKIFEVVNNSGFTTIGSGLCERIGDPANSKMKANKGSDSWRKGDTFTEPLSDHQSALSLLKHWLSDAYSPQFNLEVHSVGHRVVHGGTLTAPTVVSHGVRRAIEAACDLAPLHDPPNLHGIDAAMSTFPDVPHVSSCRQ